MPKYKPGDIIIYTDEDEPERIGVVCEATRSLSPSYGDRVWAQWTGTGRHWSRPMHAREENVIPYTGADRDEIWARWVAYQLVK